MQFNNMPLYSILRHPVLSLWIHGTRVAKRENLTEFTPSPYLRLIPREIEKKIHYLNNLYIYTTQEYLLHFTLD